jgi:hypothetical protein
VIVVLSVPDVHRHDCKQRQHKRVHDTHGALLLANVGTVHPEQVPHAPAPLSVQTTVVSLCVLLLYVVGRVLAQRVRAHAPVFDGLSADVENRAGTQAQLDASLDVSGGAEASVD